MSQNHHEIIEIKSQEKDPVFIVTSRCVKQSVLYIAEMIALTALSQLLTLEVYKVLMMINFCIPQFGKYFELFEI